jgi:hypothetical protein
LTTRAIPCSQSCGCFAHGILHKIKGRNLYRVSQAGRTNLTAFPIARQATAKQLMKKAA